MTLFDFVRRPSPVDLPEHPLQYLEEALGDVHMICHPAVADVLVHGEGNGKGGLHSLHAASYLVEVAGDASETLGVKCLVVEQNLHAWDNK